MHRWPQRVTLESHLSTMSCSGQSPPAASPGSTQCSFPCSFSLPLKICSFTDFESEVAVDLIALGKLFCHKSCQWLWNPRAIVASQSTTAMFCPHIPVFLNALPCSPFTCLQDFPEMSPIFSPILFWARDSTHC